MRKRRSRFAGGPSCERGNSNPPKTVSIQTESRGLAADFVGQLDPLFASIWPDSAGSSAAWQDVATPAATSGPGSAEDPARQRIAMLFSTPRAVTSIACWWPASAAVYLSTSFLSLGLVARVVSLVLEVVRLLLQIADLCVHVVDDPREAARIEIITVPRRDGLLPRSSTSRPPEIRASRSDENGIASPPSRFDASLKSSAIIRERDAAGAGHTEEHRRVGHPGRPDHERPSPVTKRQ